MKGYWWRPAEARKAHWFEFLGPESLYAISTCNRWDLWSTGDIGRPATSSDKLCVTCERALAKGRIGQNVPPLAGGHI